jgi:hypothetical protein
MPKAKKLSISKTALNAVKIIIDILKYVINQQVTTIFIGMIIDVLTNKLFYYLYFKAIFLKT